MRTHTLEHFKGVRAHTLVFLISNAQVHAHMFFTNIFVRICSRRPKKVTSPECHARRRPNQSTRNTSSQPRRQRTHSTETLPTRLHKPLLRPVKGSAELHELVDFATNLRTTAPSRLWIEPRPVD